MRFELHADDGELVGAWTMPTKCEGYVVDRAVDDFKHAVEEERHRKEPKPPKYRLQIVTDPVMGHCTVIGDLVSYLNKNGPDVLGTRIEMELEKFRQDTEKR